MRLHASQISLETDWITGTVRRQSEDISTRNGFPSLGIGLSQQFAKWDVRNKGWEDIPVSPLTGLVSRLSGYTQSKFFGAFLLF